MERQNKKLLHIAMFPWLAFGHMIPYLNLAKLIAQKGHSVSFISTTRNIERLTKNLPTNYTASSRITFIQLKLPHTPGLPEGAESTSDLPIDKVPYLKASFDGLEHQIAEFLESSSPNWLIHDFAPFWVGPLASSNKLGINIPTVFLSVFSASSLAYLGPPRALLDEGPESERRTCIEDMTKRPRWIPFETKVGPHHFAAKKAMEHFKDNFSGVSDAYRLGMVLKSCEAVAIRSSYEVEPEWLKVLEDIYELPVLPIGHLPPTIDEDDDNTTNINIDNEFIMKWLDEKPSNSVVYVAFGSEATVTPQELTELALGLEMSDMPFLWVLNEAQEKGLPQDLKRRVEESGTGLIHTGWAPQLNILSHRSVGGFLSHSGWSSVVEAIYFQKTLILFPLNVDHSLISRQLEEKKLGFIIPRDDRDGSFTRQSVADSVKLVAVDEEKGKGLREDVKKMSASFVDKDKQRQYVDQFVVFLEDQVQKREKGNLV